jgi:hypothetical protein
MLFFKSPLSLELIVLQAVSEINVKKLNCSINSMSFFKSLFIIHSSGKVCYSNNFDGGSLDPSIITGFSFSISSFCKSLFGEDVREISSVTGRISYRRMGNFVVVVQSDLRFTSFIVQTILNDLVGMLQVFILVS